MKVHMLVITQPKYHVTHCVLLGEGSYPVFLRNSVVIVMAIFTYCNTIN